MICPSCQNHLTPVAISGSNGGSFSVLHCQNCSGTWFASHALLDDVSTQGEVMLRSNVHYPRRLFGSSSALVCPKDKKDLTVSLYNNVSGCLLYSCSVCRGVWISQKALSLYKTPISQKTGGDRAAPFYPYVAFGMVLLALSLLSFLALRVVLQSSRPELFFQTPQASMIVGPPFSAFEIKRASSDSVVVEFMTDSPGISGVFFDRGGKTQKYVEVSVIPQTIHRVTIHGVLPNVTYTLRLHVQLQDGMTTTTKPYVFLLGGQNNTP